MIASVTICSTGLDPATDLLLGLSIFEWSPTSKQGIPKWYPILPKNQKEIQQKIKEFNSIMTLRGNWEYIIDLTKIYKQTPIPETKAKEIIPHYENILVYNDTVEEMIKNVLSYRKCYKLEDLLNKYAPTMPLRSVRQLATNLHIQYEEEQYNDVTSGTRARVLLEIAQALKNRKQF